MDLSIPTLDSLPTMPWKEKLAYLTYRFLQMPQVACPVDHLFDEGTYIREMRIPAGTLFIGRIHRHGHEVQLLSGSVIQVTEHSRREVSAPFYVRTSAGEQMVAYVLTDVVCRTLHPNPTESRDVDAMEADAFEPVGSLVALGECVGERIAYKAMLAEANIDEDRLRPLFEDESDLVPLPAAPVDIRPSPIHGQGVMATRDLVPGERIAVARIGMRRTPVGRYANHSSSPSAEMLKIGDEIVVVALKEIKAGKEITVDYRHSVVVGAQA